MEIFSMENLLKTIEDSLKRNEKNISLIHPSIISLLHDALKLEMIYDTFFIDQDIYGKIFKSSTTEWVYILLREDVKNVYLIVHKDYNSLLFCHYLYTLKSDISRYNRYNEEHSLESSDQTIQWYISQINLFEKECNTFEEKSKKKLLSLNEYMRYFSYIVSLYASIRTSVMWNAESLADSTVSHSFILHDQDKPYTNYSREKSYIIKNYEEYLYNLFDFNKRDLYQLSLTRSCMSSINLVLLYWLQQRKKNILILWVPFHETISLVETYFETSNITHIDLDEIHTDKTKKLLEETPPEAIIVDSSSLEFKPQVFDATCFNTLIKLLKQQGNNCDILIDATVKYQYLNDYLSSSHNNIFFVASLSKYFYKGMDLWFAGALIYPNHKEWINSLCQHTWAIITHQDAFKIPIIPKWQHKYIAESLNDKMKKIDSLLQEKDFEDIAIYFSNNWGHDGDFYWSYINIWFTDSSKISLLEANRKKITELIISLAKKKNIDIAYGISYGYTHTRFTLLNIWKFESIGNEKQSYIRLSVGFSSNEDDIIQIIHIISKVLWNL